MATSSSPQYRSRFGDTTMTKVFVGGLAWETPTEELRRYFEQFGDILEAVIITDKNTGRSKGYGFVTFREPESARRSVIEPNPIIDGRRANCNIASLGRPRPSPPRGRSQIGNVYQGPTMYTRVPTQIPPPLPPQMIYPPYGYMTYTPDYAYQQAMYNTQMAPRYYHQMYGSAPSSSSSVGSSGPYQYPHLGYTMPGPSSRGSFPLGPQSYGPPYVQYPTTPVEGSFTPSSSQPYTFQLQAPPHARQPLNTTVSDSPNIQQSSTSGANSGSTDA